MELKEILFATESKDALTVERFAEELPKHGAKTEQIKEISMDMSSAFIKGVSMNLKTQALHLINSML